jgi:hypothetical protein
MARAKPALEGEHTGGSWFGHPSRALTCSGGGRPRAAREADLRSAHALAALGAVVPESHRLAAARVDEPGSAVDMPRPSGRAGPHDRAEFLAPVGQLVLTPCDEPHRRPRHRPGRPIRRACAGGLRHGGAARIPPDPPGVPPWVRRWSRWWGRMRARGSTGGRSMWRGLEPDSPPASPLRSASARHGSHRPGSASSAPIRRSWRWAPRISGPWDPRTASSASAWRSTSPLRALDGWHGRSSPDSRVS